METVESKLKEFDDKLNKHFDDKLKEFCEREGYDYEAIKKLNKKERN